MASKITKSPPLAGAQPVHKSVSLKLKPGVLFNAIFGLSYIFFSHRIIWECEHIRAILDKTQSINPGDLLWTLGNNNKKNCWKHFYVVVCRNGSAIFLLLQNGYEP